MAMMQHWSLRRRTLFLGLAPAVLMLVLLLTYLVQARLGDAEREQAAAGALMARQLAASADYPVISGNLDALSGQLDTLLRTPGVVRVRLFGPDRRLVLERRAPGYRADDPVRAFTATIEQQAIPLNEEDWLMGDQGRAVPRSLGLVEISLSRGHALAREQEILFTSVVLGLIALAAAAMLAISMARYLRRPLDAVMSLVARLQTRDYTARVDVQAGGELGRLGTQLNALGENLEDARIMQSRYTAELVQARANADRANRAKSEFLAMMSHELRTPLNGVSGMLQLLATTGLNEEQKDYVRHAEQAGEDLLRMVDDILDYSRMEQGKLAFEAREFDINDLLMRLIENFRWEANERDLELVLDAPVLPAGRVLIGDPLRLRQVLSKLIDNAVKFTPRGKVSVRALLSERPQQQMLLTCEVCDTGIGIPAERLGQIFDPFVQGEAVHNRRYGGTGLGLAIARRLAELMHGSLSVDSEVDVGSCFVFEVLLPWQTQAQENQPLPRRELRARVLVVEDNPANQLVAEGMLKSLGCEVEVASDGEEALRKLATLAGRYDLVFMDCQMPNLDGYEATRRWRAQEQGRRLPVIALTAHAMDGVEASCREAGMDAVVTKPFRRAELARVLEVWLTDGS